MAAVIVPLVIQLIKLIVIALVIIAGIAFVWWFIDKYIPKKGEKAGATKASYNSLQGRPSGPIPIWT